MEPMAKHIVMCRPKYFDVKDEYSTNRWMRKNNRPNKELANEQWERLYLACFNAGMTIDLIPPRLGLYDLTFSANAGIRFGNRFIVSNYFEKPRRPESKINERFFSRVCGFDTCLLPKKVLSHKIYFEGQGDAVWLKENELLVGYGVRTNNWGVVEVGQACLPLRNAIGLTVIPLLMLAKRDYLENEKIFYHLDTCLMYLRNAGAFLVYPKAFPPESMAKLARLGEIITVTKEQAENFVCNGIEADEKTLFLPWVDEPLRRILGDVGYTNIQTFPMSEFMKSGGAVKCLILEL